jgi:DMSO/TMAO reductase YedYZ heme-binding membrane subunit
MIKLLLEFVQFLNTAAPFLTSLALLTLLSLLLAKSIKRHATVYYIVMAIPFALVAIPFVGRLFGIEVFNFGSLPFLGGITRDYIHAGTLAFPLLVIVMYTGALNPRNPVAKKLLGIRKELSILSGFPVLTHSLIRVTNNFPRALDFFLDNEGYMASGRVANAWGAGLSNFSFVLGVLMLALFIPLWVTSFDAVRKRMGGVRWKKLQRWSYVLYAMLFIHAMGIQAGSLLNPRERPVPGVAVEVTAPASDARGDAPAARPVDTRGNRGGTGVARPAAGGRPRSVGFADITVSARARQGIHVASLLLVFGSYLYLRARKARRDAVR